MPERLTNPNSPNCRRRVLAGILALAVTPFVGAEEPLGASMRIDVAEFKRLLEREAVTIVDVRSASGYAYAHVKGAVSIPLEELAGRVAEVPLGTSIVTYCTCSLDETSLRAARLFQQAGRTAKALKGGLDAWYQAGGALEGTWQDRRPPARTVSPVA